MIKKSGDQHEQKSASLYYVALAISGNVSHSNCFQTAPALLFASGKATDIVGITVTNHNYVARSNQ